MASFTSDGASGGLVKYVNDSDTIRIVIANIAVYSDFGDSQLSIELTTGLIKLELDNQAAVDSAIALLDSKF